MNKDEREILILEYIKNKGNLFSIDNIDTIVDNNIVIVTINNRAIKKNYYIHKKNNTIHTSYPINEENILKDINSIAYLTDRIENFLEFTKHKVTIIENILSRINSV